MAEEYTERLKEKRIERKEIAVFRGRSRESSFFLGGLGALYSGKAARASMRGRSLPSLSRSRRLHPARSRGTCHSISLSLASLSRSLSFSFSLYAPFDLHTVSLSDLHRTRPSLLECALLWTCGNLNRLPDFLESEKMNENM